MENEVSKYNTNIGSREIKVKDLVKKGPLLFIELSNNRKFLTDGVLIQEFSEYEYFHNVFEMDSTIYVVMEKDWQKHLIEFETKEVLVSFDGYSHDYTKRSENILEIRKKLFNLKTKEYISNTENLEPNTFCCLENDLYLFDTTEKDYLERRVLILNEKGEQLFDCGKAWPYLVGENLILIDNKQEEIKIEKYKDGKFDTENEIIIKKGQTKPHYYEGNICIVKNNIVYIIRPTQEIVKQFPLPPHGRITSSTIENNILLMSIKQEENQNVNIMGINLTSGKHFMSEKIGIRPLDMYGPATKITIAMDNIIKDVYGRETYSVKLLDENFTILYELNNVVNYNYIVCDKVDKIWLQTKEDGILYIISKQKAIKTPYTDIHYQFFDKNTKIEYGFGLDKNTNKLQIIDEEGNILIESIPYEQLGFAPQYGQFGFRYLNGYACITKRTTIIANYEIIKNSIIDSDGNILYSKTDTHVSPIGNYFQIKEKEKTIYFNTLNGEFNEKAFINSNEVPLLEEQNIFEVTEDGSVVLKQSLK